MGNSRLLIILPVAAAVNYTDDCHRNDTLNADKCPALRTMLRMSGSLKSLYCAFCDRVMTNNSHAIAVTPLLFAASSSGERSRFELLAIIYPINHWQFVLLIVAE